MLKIIVTLFLARLVISQILTPQYSCKYVIGIRIVSAHRLVTFQRTCNVVNFFRIGSDFGLSSVCMPMSCDSSTITSLHGSSCISPTGETLVCNNTGILGWNFHPVVCNCEGPVSLTGIDNSTLPIPVGNLNIDPTDLLEYQPTGCSDNSGAVLNADGPCSFKELTNIYPYYDASFGGSYTTECLPLFYPPSSPETPYYLDGSPLTCDNSVHISRTNTSYICRFGENLDAETIQPLYTPTGPRTSPSLLDCMSIRNSHDVMVDYQQALDRVQSNGVDLRPIINIVPT
jgi:hypothetical protein